MNWQKDKLTIIGFGIIFGILAVFGYLLWDMNREPIAEVPVQNTPVANDTSKPEQQAPDANSKKTEKNKVNIYAEQVKINEEGDNYDVKILRTINDGAPELLTTLRDVYNFGEGLSYNIELSPDKNNLLIQYTTSSNLSQLQVFNLDNKETQDIIVAKKDLNISSVKFSPDSKQVFFLKSTPKYNDQGGRLAATYDFNIFTIADKKNEIIKTVKTRSEIFDPRWLPDNRILLTYALETTREKPESKYEINSLNLADKKISSFPNKVFNDPNYSSNVFNKDNTLFTKAKTLTTKEFEGCYASTGTAPNSFAILETISGKEITSFKGNPEEPIDPIIFSPDNKEILYILNGDRCRPVNPEKYYVQSLYENKPREEVNIYDIIKKWDIIFNVPSFGAREIIFYQ